MVTKNTLSKSRCMKGLQCHKALWLSIYNQELRGESEATSQAFSQGLKIGELAQDIFPDGVLDRAYYHRFRGPVTGIYPENLLRSTLLPIHRKLLFSNMNCLVSDLGKGHIMADQEEFIIPMLGNFFAANINSPESLSKVFTAGDIQIRGC